MNRHLTHWQEALRYRGDGPARGRISEAWVPALASVLLLGLAMIGVTVANWILPI
ncbi:MAG TPA: hypothetical protein PLH75_09770 [Amaricoccus sp.]|uniref:hypothetical protein n=1 Tax=Amaricoccus sp. TaxID=1872485 RepID=UPI001D65F68A|nr:hypothetical protein [Amaricoccus sp.]MCC0068027.1 hypothetical protein [Rhodovulum sp.]HPG23063.1 hypothetical protein [Amaricoccus sp.]HRW13991.1 hypothetical protein [Amaricoccus sp.]